MIGVDLRQETIETRLEHGLLIDAQTGQSIGDPVFGEEDKVGLASHFERCEPGGRYVGLHTHPRSLPFSVQDVAVLLRQPVPCMIVAVGRDGTWYVMSVAPGRPKPSLDDLRSTMERHLLAIGDAYACPPFPNPMAARRAHYHAAWTLAAPDLGLRYDRIEGSRRHE
jgi:hypothetical protein